MGGRTGNRPESFGGRLSHSSRDPLPDDCACATWTDGQHSGAYRRGNSTGAPDSDLLSPVDIRVFAKDTFELGRGEFKVGEGFAVGLYSPERSLVDMIRLRHREGSDVAWEALRRWLARKGAKPAALIEMAKSLHGAERAVRNALEIVL